MDLIVILERTSVNPLTVQYLLRAVVPTARQAFFADAAKTSAYKNAEVADLAALKAGQIVEKVGSDVLTGKTIAQIKAMLIAEQAEFQAAVNGQAWNPYVYYGVSWNGTTWTAGGAS